MKWIVVENFAPNLDEHIELLDALSQDKMIFFVRKETMEFEELDETEKHDMIEENYELFKEGILWFHNKNIKRMIEIKIFEIAKQVQSLQIDNVHNSISSILEILEKKEYDKYLKQIKALIMSGILEDKAGVSLLQPGNYAFKTEKNQSHKYYASNGKLENESEYFEWHKIDNMKEMKSFIEQNLFNYDIIVAQNDNFDMQYEYYINYYEGTKNILAVRDNKGNFCNIFVNIFMGKYLIK